MANILLVMGKSLVKVIYAANAPRAWTWSRDGWEAEKPLVDRMRKIRKEKIPWTLDPFCLNLLT
jgi:hypothetical protein